MIKPSGDYLVNIFVFRLVLEFLNEASDEALVLIRGGSHSRRFDSTIFNRLVNYYPFRRVARPSMTDAQPNRVLSRNPPSFSFSCSNEISVASPRSRNSTVTSVSICFRLGSSAIQVYTSRSGGTTSRNLPLTMWMLPLGDSTPIRNPPPTLRSISATVRRNSLPTLHHFFSSLGSVQARKVLWRVAGKTREIRRES